MNAAGDEATLQAELRRQQLILLTRQLPLMVAFNTLNAFLVTTIFFRPGAPWWTMLWLAPILAFSAYQLFVWNKQRKRSLPEKVSGRSVERARYMAGIIGLVWGSVAIFFWPTDNIYVEMFILLIIAGMSAGTTSLLNPIPRIAVTFLVAILTPLVARLVWEGTAVYLVLAALIFVYAFALVLGSLRSQNHIVEIIRSGRAVQGMQADLVDAMEATSDAIAHFDAKMNLISSNSRFNEWFPIASTVFADSPEGRMRAVGEDRWVFSKLLPTSRGGFVSVHSDLTALKVREDQIQTARLSAEEASRAKSAFIEQVGVTLRAPMEEVVNYLSANIFAFDERRADVAAHAVRVLETVSDIADISTIDSQSYEYRFAFANVRTIVEWSAKAAAARFGKRRSANLQVNIFEEVADLVCDERALKRSLMHLIVNALENTPDDKDVGIDVRKAHDGQIEICVWDFGSGFEPAHLARITRVIEGVDAAPAEDLQATQGIGLGLRIVTQVIQRHRGALKILSEPTLGTFAYVKLPYRATVSPPAEAVAANDDADSDAALDRARTACAS